MALCLRNETDIGDFIRGVTLYGVGGGGNPVLGTARITEILEKFGVVELIDPASIPDEEMTCCVFGMGSVAPTSDQPGIYGQRARQTKDPNVRALQELEKLTNTNIAAVVPSETGGLNTVIGLHAGAMLGKKIVDGDYSGRAKPELSQAIPVVNGKDIMPFAVCDDWGNVIHIIKTASPATMEAIGKQISVITKAPDKFAICAHAGMLMPAREMKKHIVSGSLSQATLVGRLIREANACGAGAAEAAAKGMSGRVLFKGNVTELIWESGGYMSGYAYVDGSGDYSGSKFKFWFRNENHLAWRDGRVVAMSPDLIAVVRQDNGEPITNGVLTKGDAIAVLGAPHMPSRTEASIAAMGPRHFDFDMDYVEIEKLW